MKTELKFKTKDSELKIRCYRHNEDQDRFVFVAGDETSTDENGYTVHFINRKDAHELIDFLNRHLTNH